MYYVKKILSCFYSEFTFLQKEEVKYGLQNGLAEHQVVLYASCEFNHLQMEQMRLALEHGISTRVVRRYMHADMHVEKMKEIRLRLENGEHLKRDYMHMCLPFFTVVVCVCLGLTLYKDEKPYLQLKTDTVRLKCGQTFDPMEYIDSFSSYQGQLILPSSFDTENPGNHVVVYKLQTKRETLEKMLYVSVE